jgi:GNAT superfamily N-acetyltransferase
MVLTEAVDADLNEVVELANVAYRSAGEGASWNSETGIIAGVRTTEKALREDVAAKPKARLMLWRVEDVGELQGTVWLEPKSAEVWYLGLLTVRPGLQNQGLGRALLAAAEGYVRAQGGIRVRMTVLNVRAGLIAWYQRRGYALTGETEAFPYGDERFGTPLRDDLYFVVMERGIL